jgi:hypothetical protein
MNRAVRAVGIEERQPKSRPLSWKLSLNSCVSQTDPACGSAQAEASPPVIRRLSRSGMSILARLRIGKWPFLMRLHESHRSRDKTSTLLRKGICPIPVDQAPNDSTRTGLNGEKNAPKGVTKRRRRSFAVRSRISRRRTRHKPDLCRYRCIRDGAIGHRASIPLPMAMGHR